ncbi:MAG: hypothetical protein ISN28_14365 [Ectothiorhodospiraceae bacterium AqS1]|nr:hypothetical protein [Ectothiorhodospiraceae bacterium AqS1]
MNEQWTPQEKKDFALASLRAIMADGLQIDQNKMNCLYQIFATIEFDYPFERQNVVLMTVFEPKRIFDPEVIKRVLETDEDDKIRTELAKQAILACQVSGGSEANARLNDFLIYELKFSKEQISVLKEGVRLGNSMVDKLKKQNGNINLSKDEKEKLQSLLKRAKDVGLSATAAIGLPMTGLYFAGITGFSAVGITTGLATIGKMSGLTLLGLNPMTAGILALGLFGYGIYRFGKKIIDFFKKESDRKTIEDYMRKLYSLICHYAEEDRRQFIAEKKSLEEKRQQCSEKERELDDERSDFDRKIISLEKEKESVSFEREEIDSKCNSLAQEIKSLEKQNKATSHEVEKTDRNLEFIEQEKNTLEDKKQSSIFERKKLECGGIFRKVWNYIKGRTLKVIDLEIEEIEKSIENRLSRIKDGKKQKENVYQNINEIENKIKITTNNLDTNKKNLDSIDLKIIEIEDRKKKILENIELNQAQKDIVREDIDHLDFQIENLNRIIALLGHVINVHRSIDQMRLGNDSKPLLGFDGSK